MSGSEETRITLRYVDGHPQGEFVVGGGGVGELRGHIRRARPELSRRRLKLLANGRVLRGALQGGRGGHMFVDCIVGEELDDEGLMREEEMDVQPKKTTSEAMRGFDRLLSQGFDEQEVEDMRRQFLSLHGNVGAGAPVGEGGRDLRDLEDQWMDSTAREPVGGFGSGSLGGGETATASGGADWGALLGVLAGFSFGGLALLLLYLKIGGVFTKRNQVAVVCGVGINLGFSLLKFWS